MIAGALHLAYWQSSLIKAIVVLIAVPTATALIVQTFLFKTMAHMQSRLGPMEAGPHGSLQLMADGAKFIQKELIAPERADRMVFGLAPIIVLVSTFMLYVVIPIGPGSVGEPLDTGIFFALAVSSISVIGILAAGWASANKYSLIGGLRAAGQLIAYELPLVLAVVGVVMMAGTLSLQGIVASQAHFRLFGSHVVIPFVLPQFVGFILFLIAAQAELTQTPFDMPIAESELVAGYQTEYSGLLFLFFYIGEFGTAFGLAAIASTLFLGGWWIPLYHPTGAWGDLFGFGVLFAKTMIVSFLIFWIRFTYPRFREDQLQAFAWKVLIPIALANLLVTALFKVVVGSMAQPKVPGLIKGLGVTLKTMLKPSVTVQYTGPHGKEREAPPTRARGVIALKEENCTVCMLCVRSCPDWCIYIEGYKDKAPPRREGGRPRSVQYLDRFDIDYGLCMYCGICVEVCPFDALFWSPEFEYSEPRIADLLHDKDRLGEWMETVPEPLPLEAGAEVKKGGKK